MPFYLLYLMAASVVGLAYLYSSANVKFKRIILPITLIIVAGLFLSMMWTNRQQLWVPTFILLGSLIAVYFSVRFCPRCGATTKSSFWQRVNFCPKCGAKMTDDSSRD
jgi:hypothetical protein